jgi:hypothetical protein
MKEGGQKERQREKGIKAQNSIQKHTKERRVESLIVFLSQRKTSSHQFPREKNFVSSSLFSILQV